MRKYFLEIRSNYLGRDYNKKLDNYLNETNMIPLELHLDLKEAYDYDAATSVGWLKQKLVIIRERVREGELIEIEDYCKNLNEINFNKWVFEMFPMIKNEMIIDNKQLRINLK